MANNRTENQTKRNFNEGNNNRRPTSGKGNWAKKETSAAPMERKKIEVVTYSKTFTSFFDGMEEMTLCSNVVDYFLSEFGSDYRYIDAAIGAVAHMAAEYTPNPVSKENIHFDFKISKNACRVKTNKFIGFGWNSKLTEDKSAAIYTFFVDVYGTGSIQAATIDTLKSNSWGVFSK